MINRFAKFNVIDFSATNNLSETDPVGFLGKFVFTVKVNLKGFDFNNYQNNELYDVNPLFYNSLVPFSTLSNGLQVNVKNLQINFNDTNNPDVTSNLYYFTIKDYSSKITNLNKANIQRTSPLDDHYITFDITYYFSSTSDIVLKNIDNQISDAVFDFDLLEDFELSYNFSINNQTNIENIMYKIGAKHKRTILSKSFKNILKERSNRLSNVPFNRITTGKVLPDDVVKFDDKKTFLFINRDNTHSTIGLPLINVLDANDSVIEGSYYINNNENISSIKLQDTEPNFLLHNTSMFEKPNNIDNSFKSSSLVTSKKLDKVVERNQIEENISAYKENFYHDFKNSDATNDFLSNTIERSKAETYDISSQKQIKIKMNFKNSCNLLLLNTKFNFNYPNPVLDNENADVVSNTKFINFLNEDNSSYSSHFMPTAYWDFNNERWSYLEGLVYEENFNWPDSVNQNFDKTDLLGSKNFSNIKDNISYTNDIYTNLFEESKENSDFNALLKSYKPIVTTPGFRNDGSMLSENNRISYNKSYLSQITSSYGFPYKNNWSPRNSHVLDMSNYLAKDFLLEKIIIKGKYTSRGEMPVKKGNFASGFISNGDNSYDYNHDYDYKENHQGVISNNITFFILNEKINTNVRQDSKKPIGLQKYAIQKKQVSSKLNALRSFNGKVLHDYEGSFNEYNSETNDTYVNVSTFKNSNTFSIDNLNNSSLSSGSEIATSSKNTFTYLSKNIDDEPNNFVDLIYVNENNQNIQDYDLTSDSSAKSYSILHEEILDAEENTNRELVGYANLLISSTNVDIELDNEVLKNIDLLSETKKQSNILNLNRKQKNSFEVFATLKNIKQSEYNSESVYKLKSNYYKQVIDTTENSSFEIRLAAEQDNLQGNTHGILSLLTGTLKSAISIDTSADQRGEAVSFLNNNKALISSKNVLSNTNVLPVSLPYYNFRFFDSLRNEYKIELRFSYGEVRTFDDSMNFSSLSPNTLLLSPDQDVLSHPITSITQYITYGEYQVSGETINIVDINFKLFDAWPNTDWNNSFFALFDNSFGQDILQFFKSTTISSNNIDSALKQGIRLNIEEADFNFGNFIEDNLEESSSCILKIILSAIFLKSFIYHLSKQDQLSLSWIDGNIPTTPYYAGYGYDSDYSFIEGYKNTTGLVETVIDESLSLSVTDASNFEKLSNSLFANKTIKINSFTDGNGKVFDKCLVAFNNSIDQFNPISEQDQSILFEINDNSLLPILSIDDTILGNTVFRDINYNMQDYVLEGKSVGDASNLGEQSERLIDINTFEDQAGTSFKTTSGKTINSQVVSNNIIKSNYVLKPTDRLVFGVSSNSNGQVMPTVFELHDELEITLIGRDFEEKNLDIVNNQNTGITKTIVGYDTTNKTGISISQSKNNYFDNVWSNSSKNIEINLSKSVVGKNSSKKFGSINEFLTFENSLSRGDNVIYKKDSILPSITNLALNLYESTTNAKAEIVYLRDNLDLYYEKSIPKIIFSENIDIASVGNQTSNYNYLYSKIICDWHDVYPYDHSSTKDYFASLVTNDLLNTSLGDAVSYSGDVVDDVAIYFDISSYSLGLNYDKTLENGGGNKFLLEQINSLNFESNYVSKFKTINNYVLPNTQFGKWQHSIKINNFDKFEAFSKEFFSFLELYGDQPENLALRPSSSKKSFIRNDVAIDISSNLLQEENFYKFEKCTLQYLKNANSKNDLTDNTADSVIDENLGQWHLVVELSSEEYMAILSEIDSSRTFNLNNKELSFIIAPSMEDPNNSGNYILSDVLNGGGLGSYNNRVGKILINSNAASTSYFLIFPLYFWDTLEVNGLYFQNLSSDNNSRSYENESDLFKLNAEYSGNYWLGKTGIDNSGYVSDSVSHTQNDTNLIYKPFIDSSDLSLWDTAESWNTTFKIYPKAESIVSIPYTYFDLLNLPDEDESNYTQSLISKLNKGTLFVKLLNNDDIEYNKNILEQDLSDYKILREKIKYKEFNYLGNDLETIAQKQDNAVNNDIYLGEKIYLSSINRKSNNRHLETQNLLAYKFKWHQSNGDDYRKHLSSRDDIFNIDQNISLYPMYYPYYLIEIKGINSKHTVLSKNKCLETNLIYDTSKKDIETSIKQIDGDVSSYIDDSKSIRIYEESLRQAQNISNANITLNKKDENVPYFDIRLSDTKFVSQQLSNDEVPVVENTKFVYQIPYTHYKINTTVDTGIISDDSYQLWNVGSPVFYFNESNEGYDSEREINNKSKLFLYGVSTKGKYKYPIESLNRFKYGIENAIPEGYKHHYSSRSFGNLSDRIMGSKNYVHVVERSDGNISNFTVIKSFVDPTSFTRLDLQEQTTVDMLDSMNVYNKDIYCRSTKPFLDVYTQNGV